MRTYISVILIFVLLTSVSINIFAENIQTDITNNENIDEYAIEDMENTVIVDHNCNSCRVPNLNIEDQEQIIFFDPLEAIYHQEDYAFLNTYASYYFLKLEDSIPDNFSGSCSYVAATMLLSFYDTYWDGNIVDDQYEIKTQFNSNLSLTSSPSTKTHSESYIKNAAQVKFPDKNTFTDADYYEVLKDLFETDLQRKLINIAVEEYIDGIFEYFSLFPHEVYLLLRHYLYNEIGFSSSEVSVELVVPGITNIKEYAIAKVKQGIPVFVSAMSSLNEAHSFIIYDYDETNDELYCHMGWRKQKNSDGEYDTTHVAFSSIPYQSFEGAVSISFNSEHSHSDNYVDVYGNSYCSCYFSCHPEHEHTYTLTADGSYHTYSCSCRLKETPNFEHSLYISEINEDGHRYKCSTCNYESELIEHNMRFYLYSTPTQHGYKCRDCGHIDESTVETHSYDYWVYLNSTTHVSECDCGARGTTTASHVYTFPDSDGWMTCIGCGYTKIFGSDSGLIIMSTTKVSSNGSRIISDGTIMLVDEDIEAYLDGTLVFYDKDNLPQTQ